MLLQTIFHWLPLFQPTSPPDRPVQLAVTAAGKAGLAWPNGNTVDISQYLTTNKVSW